MESAAGYFLIDWSGVSALGVTPARLSTEMISVLFCSWEVTALIVFSGFS